MKIPDIKIELIHIDGPFKGQINEYLKPEITFGRHPDCDVVFPEDMLIISRHHAEIRREGNRFLLKDTSSNGTFVNGKQNAEVFLKNGDVLILGTGGPKISFLSTILEMSSTTPQEKDHELSNLPEPPLTPRNIQVPPEEDLIAQIRPVKIAVNPAETPNSIPIATVQKPLVIQYGMALKTFKTLPIVLGNSKDCDFTIDAPSILARHAQVFFNNGEYWIKDLSGRNTITVDQQVVGTAMPLPANCHLSLGPTGPKFQFLGDGRLLEVAPAAMPSVPRETPVQRITTPKPSNILTPDHRKNKRPITAVLIVTGCLAAVLLGYVILRMTGGSTDFFSNFSVEKILGPLDRLFNK